MRDTQFLAAQGPACAGSPVKEMPRKSVWLQGVKLERREGLDIKDSADSADT